VSDAPICELKGVQKTFERGGGQPLRVLEDIDFEVRPNEVVCLIGPSGCGKSTILRILAGLIKPTRGEVRYHGQKLEGLTPGVAMVFQGFALFPWMTVEANVDTVLRARELPEPEVRSRARHAIQLVGLSGFERAYPRELSGGMKQRVGMARALSVDPEMLFMDEPFSQVDALTAEGLRAEILDIWDDSERNPSSIVMVSHDSKEVAYMADRIVVLSSNPGRIRTVVENRLQRPRDTRSPEFLRLVDQIHDIITSTELPDVVVSAPAEAVAAGGGVEPLPDAQVTDILGLLEFLESRGGSAELFQIAAQTHTPFDRMVRVVKAAEILDLVDTPRRVVLLTPLGQHFVRAEMEERKHIWREQLLKLRLFKVIDEGLAPGNELPKAEVMQELAARLPMEDAERIFETLLGWGRFGDLFDYDDDRGLIASE